MPAVSDERLKGNYGTSVVIARFSADCLVRPVASDTDVGVDLYCETVDAGQPFLHFWVQVKTGQQCRLNSLSTEASCSFDIDHLRYWHRQPVPVFAALVPTEWPVEREPGIYIIDVTRWILERGFPRDQASISLSSNYRCMPGDRDSVRAFLGQVVPATTARLRLSAGVIADEPTLMPKYERNRPFVPVLKYSEAILYQLRRTAAMSIFFGLGPSTPATIEEANFHRLLARIVQTFVDTGDGHWENFWSLGLSKHSDGDYEGALMMYERARGSIEADLSVRDQAGWRMTVSRIQELADRARLQRPLHLADSDNWAI
jgi:hypothetical protein